jgi:glycosyltransferase involved in cell wall biosynthesis
MGLKYALYILYIYCLIIIAPSTLTGAEAPYHVLVGSPIRQNPAILREFLSSLDRLPCTNYVLDYYFVDDNIDADSQRQLQEFSQTHAGHCTIILAEEECKKLVFNCTEHTHEWKDELIWKVARFKDGIINFAKENNYDYLFFIDSDIVLHPMTIEQLISANKPIISNVFWTCWQPDAVLLPQVWMQDQYAFFEKKGNEQLTPEQEHELFVQFVHKIRHPGTYEVGGLGACTLISKEAINKGISFKKIKNISLWGEDRHFCVRAAALDIGMYVDTHYPSYHIYRESALSDIEDFKLHCAQYKKRPADARQRITLSMVMKNEASRYLRQMLESAKTYITDAVIIDDGSSDNSVEICREVLKDIPLVLIRNEQSKFNNEIDLRMQQWKATTATNPDWIVILDADEVFEPDFANHVNLLISNDTVDAYYFRLYDFWDEQHYRQDTYWNAHETYRPFLIRHRPDFPQQWSNKQAQHCGRVPTTVHKLVGATTRLRVKHYGWAKEEDRIAKYKRYKELNPDARYGIKAQYESILDAHPALVKWID